ncbi:MAG: lipoprotein signal peptidase [Saprospiraceae bacterium]
MLKRSTLVLTILALVLLLDQMLKLWVKTHLSYGEQFSIFGTDWAYIHFVENNGMAFGISFGGELGKLALSLFRIAAVVFLGFLIRNLIKQSATKGLLVCLSLVMAGAIGNILDSAFYGLLFSASDYHGGLSQFMGDDGGYAPFLHGKVVDMFYFPIIDTILPDWFPIWGGQRFEFFKPIFNVADTAISIGIISLLLFQRKFITHSDNSSNPIQHPVEPEASTNDVDKVDNVE